MKKKNIIIAVIAFLLLSFVGVYGYKAIFSGPQDTKPAEQTSSDTATQTSETEKQVIKVGSIITANQGEEDIDLLNKKNFGKTPPKQGKLLSVLDNLDREQIKKKAEKGFHVFFTNNGNNDRQLLQAYNKYMKNVSSNNVKGIKFYSLGNISHGKCVDTFQIKKKSYISLFDKFGGNLKILNLLEYIKKINKTNDALFIINGTDLSYTCNNIDEIKKYMQKNRERFPNVIIIMDGEEKRKETISKKFFEDLAFLTGIRIETFVDTYRFNEFLEKNIYAFNKNQAGFFDDRKDINTKIFFYNENEQKYSGDLIIMKKQGNSFKAIQKLSISDVYYGSLNPGIYYFIGYDPVKKIYLETEPQSININNPYSYSFVFRTTKVELKLLGTDGKPILGNFYVDFSSPNEKTQKSYTKQSSVIFYGNPGTYKVKVDVLNKNDSFQSSFEIKGEKSFSKTFTTKEVPVEIRVKEKKSLNLKNNVVVTLRKNGHTVVQKNGGDFTANISVGDYELSARDIDSGAEVKKKITVRDTTGTQKIEIFFEIFDVSLDLGLEPVIVELYNENSQKKIKSISGTGLRNIKLPEGKYIARVYNIDKTKTVVKPFSVSSFYENTVEAKL